MLENMNDNNRNRIIASLKIAYAKIILVNANDQNVKIKM